MKSFQRSWSELLSSFREILRCLLLFFQKISASQQSLWTTSTNRVFSWPTYRHLSLSKLASLWYQTNILIDWLVGWLITAALTFCLKKTEWSNKCRVNTEPLGIFAVGSWAKMGPNAGQCQQAAVWLQGTGWEFFLYLGSRPKLL